MNPSLVKIFVFLTLFAGLALTACAPSGLRLAGREAPLEAGDIYDLIQGRPVSFDDLIGRLAWARVVYLGEFHTHPTIHRRQLEIIRALWAEDPRLAVGLEVFDRPQQEILDQWTAGKLSEREFTDKVLEGVLDPATFKVYFPLLDWARRNEIPLAALNAPRAVSRQAARVGLSGLDDETRSMAAEEIVIGPPEYRERVARAFESHGMAQHLDRFFEAQVIWDETMAETAARFLESPLGRDRRLVVIAGNEHIRRGWGVPDRVTRRIDAARALVLMPVSAEDETLTAGDADFAWVARPEDPPQTRRLGVMLDTADGGLVVKEVAPDSEAARIGLQPGDRLTALDGREAKTAMDLHRAAMENPDGEHELTVDRGGRIMKFKFKFK